MKTASEILGAGVYCDEVSNNIELVSRREAVLAMKEYAKQWVEEAAMLASSQAALGGDVVNTVLELLKEIDNQ